MNKKSLLIITTAVILSVTAFSVISAQSAAETDNKSVGWYAANLKAAQQQNRICHENRELINTEECINSLHALTISFNGGN